MARRTCRNALFAEANPEWSRILQSRVRQELVTAYPLFVRSSGDVVQRVLSGQYAYALIASDLETPGAGIRAVEVLRAQGAVLPIYLIAENRDVPHTLDGQVKLYSRIDLCSHTLWDELARYTQR